jgi:hypothetical protein
VDNFACNPGAVQRRWNTVNRNGHSSIQRCSTSTDYHRWLLFWTSCKPMSRYILLVDVVWKRYEFKNLSPFITRPFYEVFVGFLDIDFGFGTKSTSAFSTKANGNIEHLGSCDCRREYYNWDMWMSDFYSNRKNPRHSCTMGGTTGSESGSNFTIFSDFVICVILEGW